MYELIEILFLNTILSIGSINRGLIWESALTIPTGASLKANIWKLIPRTGPVTTANNSCLNFFLSFTKRTSLLNVE